MTSHHQVSVGHDIKTISILKGNLGLFRFRDVRDLFGALVPTSTQTNTNLVLYTCKQKTFSLSFTKERLRKSGKDEHIMIRGDSWP